MAIKVAGTINHTWQVYDHQPPVFVGKDKFGDDQYRANLVPVGIITATTNSGAWVKAHDLCSLPVLEVIQNVH
jgi:hypothetical protein